MQRERITNEIYVFTSDRYAQVNAGVILTPLGAVVIGTLVYPDETLHIKRYVEEKLHSRVRYVINTHYHADHTNGTCFFEGATLISHAHCRHLLDTRGRASMEETRLSSPEMADLRLVLPDTTFTDTLTLYLGNKTLKLWATPGHTPDSIVCLVEEDQVLFAADTVMPVPYFIDGNYDELLASLEALSKQTYENIIQGYGEIVLRGEVHEKINGDINYLVNLRQAVEDALGKHDPQSALNQIDIESCGISRVLLNGMVEQLHRQNVNHLAQLLKKTAS
jgi:cyclase